ncbi:MAG: uracil-DNA glycosylase [Dehalococcoidales bacterium]|nr:uracil-DNA glycosylase [Dehalococcoidales bacterium]
MKDIKLPLSWKSHLKDELGEKYIEEIISFLKQNYKNGKEIFPKPSLIFNAFNYSDFENIKVVILGQDPYHGNGQAHGLSFSVPKTVPLPPSLKNIYKELSTDLEIQVDYKNGNLEKWAKQGVFLLNSTLTVEKNKPLSHSKIGWERFTSKVIEILSKKRKNLVFILWGKHAQNKIKNINHKEHLIIESPHPSPLSSYRGFFGSKPFSKTNKYLRSKNIEEVDWSMVNKLENRL